ncbi:MAG TPA: hypothetical protein VHD33_02385 [Legionellaceae bacterium]|nr:hypothetical protein [Legionellaceae bacterium]
MIDQLQIPGEHAIMIQGPAGMIETVLDVPVNVDSQYLAILGHPHSLQGGTMNNKVVTTMARSFRELGIASIRFNFRGVGQTEGAYEGGVGESEDMLHLLHMCQCPDLKVFFAGFSFGSYVAFRALTHYQQESAFPNALITIAPSVHHYDYTSALKPNTPWLIVIGEDDEIVPVDAVTDFVKTRHPSPNIEYFAETGHFFHGKLLDLKARLQTHIRDWMKA